MPQLDFGPFLSEFYWLILIVFFCFFCFFKFILPQIFLILKVRENKELKSITDLKNFINLKNYVLKSIKNKNLIKLFNNFIKFLFLNLNFLILNNFNKLNFIKNLNYVNSLSFKIVQIFKNFLKI